MARVISTASPLCLLVSAILAGCAAPVTAVTCDEAAASDSCHALDPGQPGPYPVGVTTLFVEDPERTNQAGDLRRLRVEVWYPATPAATSLPLNTYDLVDDAPPELAAQVPGYTIPMPEHAAYRDAEPALADAPYPLLAFSHGNGGLRLQNLTLMVHLASHGYVVAAPDHVDNTLWDFVLGHANGAAILLALSHRPKDLTSVADFLDTTDGALAGMADLENFGVLGHSFGGGTSIGIMARRGGFLDPRVDAAMPMAPAVSIYSAFGAGPADTQGPLFTLAGESDATLDYAAEQRLAFDEAPGIRGLVTAHNAGHFSFSELCLLDLAPVAAALNYDISGITQDGCDAGFTSMELMHLLQNHYGAAFFNTFLRASESSANYLLPDGIPAALIDEVTVETDDIKSTQ